MAMVFMNLDPKDIFQMAKLNRAFRRASSADFVLRFEDSGRLLDLENSCLPSSDSTLSQSHLGFVSSSFIFIGGCNGEVWCIYGGGGGWGGEGRGERKGKKRRKNKKKKEKNVI